ncbi:hypothetical protein ACHRVK_10000 [Flavobacterium plurextorum]|uniref:hypothetical protein n=1 Tax=Flavobacterium plurextorum TaxID=1114867 RepID=UPI003756647A
MDTGKEIIEFTKQVLDNASKIDDLIDSALDPIKDYTDTIGDLITPIKGLITILNLKKRLTLRAFIINYSSQLYGSYIINEKETIKLQNYLKDKKNLSYISEIIDNAINSKSLKASALLGSIAGNAIKEKKELTYEYFSIIDTLRILTDYDIENFIILYEYLPQAGTSHDETEEYRTSDFYDSENTTPIHLNRDLVELTIEKMKRTNGLTYNEGGIGQSGNAKGCFEINNVTKELYRIIKLTQTAE